MAQPAPVTSTRYPYLPVRVTIRGRQFRGEAPLDTGFTGHLAIPPGILGSGIGLPDARIDWQLADGSIIGAAIFYGTVEIVGLLPVPAAITVLGDECILGRGVIDRFRVTFDHGSQVIAEI